MSKAFGFAYLAVAALGLASSQPLFAQDGSEVSKARTKESAQEFLQVTSSTPVGFRLIQQGTRNHRSGMKFVGPYPNAPCSSKMIGREDYESWGIGDRWDRITNDDFEYFVSWNSIAKVSQNGPFVRLDWSNGITPVEFGYASDDLARRAASAMEFLRVECDPTKNLAF